MSTAHGSARRNATRTRHLDRRSRFAHAEGDRHRGQGHGLVTTRAVPTFGLGSPEHGHPGLGCEPAGRFRGRLHSRASLEQTPASTGSSGCAGTSFRSLRRRSRGPGRARARHRFGSESSAVLLWQVLDDLAEHGRAGTVLMRSRLMERTVRTCRLRASSHVGPVSTELERQVNLGDGLVIGQVAVTGSLSKSTGRVPGRSPRDG